MVILIPGLRPAMAGDDLVLRFYLNQKHYVLNGTQHNMDAVTFAENGRTYVPIRYLGESLGASVEWKDPMIILTKGGKTVQLMVGVKKMMTTENGAPVDKAKFLNSATGIDAAPLARQGRTYLPARHVAVAFGYNIDYNSGIVVVSSEPTSADPTNPPIEYDDRGWPVIKVETAQKLFGPLVPPDKLIGNGNRVALKLKSRDVILNPEVKVDPEIGQYIVGGTLLKNYLPAPLDMRIGTYVDRNGIMRHGQDEYYPLKEMLLLGGFPEQNIFWNPQTKTMVIYGSHFFDDRYYSVTKIVAGQELRRKNLVPSPIVENGSLLISDADYDYVCSRAYRDGSVPLPTGWIGNNIKWFE
jgi:hypothetical protein